MPLQATSGAASYDAFGGGVPVVPNYIEDCFSTYLYTGNGSTQTITNGIDLSGKGGLVWLKSRSLGGEFHRLFDTSRGVNNLLASNATFAQQTGPSTLTAFNTTGFNLGSDPDGYGTNTSAATYASWTFREQPKFFDVVTYTGTQNSSGTGQVVSHNLGSTPGCIIIKPLSDTSGSGFTLNDWIVYHRGLSSPTTQYLKLNSTASIDGNSDKVQAVSSTTFTAGWEVGLNGIQYVAYIYAHNAGGFGLTGTDNVISCSSFTTDGSGNATVDLGYEPQWLLVKANASGNDWYMYDNMRGLSYSNYVYLSPNLSAAEGNIAADYLVPTATGFQTKSFAGSTTYIYIAIRRGPMKVPTSGASVLGLSARTGTGANATVTGGAGVSDAVLIKNRGSAVASLFSSRLTGTGYLVTTSVSAEVAAGGTILQANPWDVMDGVKVGTTSTITNASGSTFINYLFKRAPSVFDIVCYTGSGGATTVAHNLQAVPQLMLIKQRTASPVGSPFTVYSATLGNTGVLFLDSDGGNQGPDNQWNSTTPTSSVFSLGSNLEVNYSGSTFIAYLFATCAGVSKVGSYTGTGTTLQIDCGFTSGARFVLIKRSGTGGWYVWDSARGIVSGDDPYLLLNSTAAEVTNTDYIDTYSAGFEISSTAPAAINASGGTFIFLAIA